MQLFKSDADTDTPPAYAPFLLTSLVLIAGFCIISVGILMSYDGPPVGRWWLLSFVVSFIFDLGYIKWGLPRGQMTLNKIGQELILTLSEGEKKWDEIKVKKFYCWYNSQSPARAKNAETGNSYLINYSSTVDTPEGANLYLFVEDDEENGIMLFEDTVFWQNPPPKWRFSNEPLPPVERVYAVFELAKLVEILDLNLK